MKQSDLELLRKVAVASKDHTTEEVQKVNESLVDGSLDLNVKSVSVNGEDIMDSVENKTEEVVSSIVDEKVISAVKENVLIQEVNEENFSVTEEGRLNIIGISADMLTDGKSEFILNGGNAE